MESDILNIYLTNLIYIIDNGINSLNVNVSDGAPRGFGDLGRMAIYFQGSEEHWQLF